MGGSGKNIICKIHVSTGFHTQNIAYPILRIIGTCNDTPLIQLDNLNHTKNKTVVKIVIYDRDTRKTNNINIKGKYKASRNTP